ncbi:MAG: nucleotidyl transferase AbiEii/AbiGii toxin family protein, partial [Clostridia bacterium]|nr:nucleotidyl transferase AbiEii/AbiGii toxin family protein [Clostridia bacterium]
YIFSDPGMRENDTDAIRARIQRTFADRAYRQRLERSRSSNWMEISVSEVLERLTAFLNSL